MAKKKISKKQAEHRKYLKSKEWKNVRERYYSSKLIQVCYVCEKNSVRLDLHHRTYDRWGKERLTDLTPVHRKCHNQIHKLHRKYRKTITLWEATSLARNNFRKKNT